MRRSPWSAPSGWPSCCLDAWPRPSPSSIVASAGSTSCSSRASASRRSDRLGSAYYHLAPDNVRLVWDRLPITLAFMAIVAAVVGERIDVALGLGLLALLLALGVASVLYWHATEQRGAGDLRVYVLVQFVPLLVVPLLLALYEGRYTRGRDLLFVVAVYGVAKLFELGDGVVFGLGHVVSGHTLKHLTAAGAAYGVVRMLDRRTSWKDFGGSGRPRRPLR